MTVFPKYHVASGSYRVDTTKPLILQAFLGTCVAVAIFDARKGVGGIIHSLLPEPVSSGYPYCPEKYMSTGLPQFLKELYKAGAEPKNMKAYLAGGSLIKPLNQQDVHLNIGGRSAQIAGKLLQESNIQIIKSETGGFGGYSLNLNMAEWCCDISPSVPFDLSPNSNYVAPNKADLKKAAARLQPIPQIIFSILKMINEDTCDIKELSREVKKDQVLTAKTIKLSNSALFAVRKKIESIDDAIAILGQELFSRMIISVAVQNYFDHASSGYSLSKGGLYHHALGTAIIAQRLAEMNPCLQPDVAYTAGLLHDIGKVVLDQFVMYSYPLFYRLLMEEKRSIMEAEQNILGVDHTVIGGELAESWEFPESMIHVIQNHHHATVADEHDPLTSLIALSNLLMHMFSAGPELYLVNTGNLEPLLTANGFSLSLFPDIVDAIPVQALSSSPELAIIQG
ncbi:MAG: HDOD domain-containing protein [Proteobacteria bacterium]|nr:HDOD domain-containing protein [Pseudomonadota bacterium]